VQSELSNVLRLVEWWNGLPACGDNPTTPSFDFQDDPISALNRVTTLHPVLWPSFYERLGDTSGWVAHNEFVKLGQLMVRCSVLSRAFIYGALQALERSKYHARVLWQNAIKCMLFEYLLAGDSGAVAQHDVDYQVMELEIRLDCVWRQMAAHGNLLSEPTRGALERINKLPNPLWRQHIRAMINLYLTEPGNPPQLLLSALNTIGEYEQQEQCTLLTLAVWKAQCVVTCKVLLFPAVGKDERFTASFDDRQWTACKQEQWNSNAMTVIVPLVRSFLGGPPLCQYTFRWINNDVTIVNPGVWWEVIAMETRQTSP
jgi:hypothetical protein